MKLCFDTNVVIDILARSEAYPESYYACDIANVRRFESCISATSVTDVAYVLHRFGHSNAAVKRALKRMFELFDVFDVNESDCRSAVDSSMGDLEDALLSIAAQRNGADMLITRDKKGFKRSTVPFMAPKDFVKQFCPPDYEYDLIELA